MEVDSSVAESEPTPQGHAVDVMIVAALDLELEPLRLRLKQRCVERGSFRVDLGELAGRTVALVETGPGETNSVAKVDVACRAYPPQRIMSIGLAGGLIDALEVGDIVIADRVVVPISGDRSDETAPIEIHSDLRADRSQRRHVGTLVTVSEPVLSESEKRARAIASQAIAVDMETYSLARWCVHQKKRLIAVRSISDAVRDSLPPVVRSLVGAHLFEQFGRVAGTFFRRPKVVKELWQLRSRALLAADRLGEEVVTIVASLD